MARANESPGITGQDGLPPGFDAALEAIRATIHRCEAQDIPARSILAAIVCELMPRMVGLYGAAGVASALGDLAAYLDETGLPGSAREGTSTCQ